MTPAPAFQGRACLALPARPGLWLCLTVPLTVATNTTVGRGW